ncbi:UDP-N-acetylglucosamine 2-epimerase [Opitutus terrae PB90-1]|uniref:UDP-N-acetylglucosamine 2-epimerase (non-hydrolyzing) n=2 Tax=Opitutus terrae TaxID=107709 RepID=B1ZW35_OPITP|nr:UDP-N-acetylglucosamine 2-epimerase [Opitutus terrae PB90-1]
MAPVISRLRHQSDAFQSVVVSTGQHREMLDQALQLFGITPDQDLQLMRADQSLAQLTARLFESLDRVLDEFSPDWVLAQGDTTTVLVTSLLCHYRRIPFGHVEAGLRSGDKWRPFPEETNRRVADLVADAYFAPTAAAADNLRREGCAPEHIFVTGNTVIDALLEVASRPFDWSAHSLPPLPSSARMVLITAHRRESFGAPFRELCEAIRELAQIHAEEGVHFLYPMHLNPNVRRPVGDTLSDLANVHLIEPVDYFTMVHLMKRASLVLTDSGGVQEEAPSLGVPVLVMRDTTERPEGIDAGVAKLVGTARPRIVAESTAILSGRSTLRTALGASPYGDGHAAQRIVEILRARTS